MRTIPSSVRPISPYLALHTTGRLTTSISTVQLNRSSARSRDESRSSSAGAGLPSDAGCAAVFTDMVCQSPLSLLSPPLHKLISLSLSLSIDRIRFLAAWSNRATILTYCTSVVDKLAASPESATTSIPLPASAGREPTFVVDGHPADASSWRWTEAGVGRSPGTRDVGRSDGELLVRSPPLPCSVELLRGLKSRLFLFFSFGTGL